MSNRSNFSKPGPALDLDTLPDFMRSPNPQVKFHSAFPPLTTKVRVRGVMERAGFDVYRPEKDKSISSGTRSPRINDFYSEDDGQFHPPNRFHSNRSSSSSQKSPNRVPIRSYSHNQTRRDTTFSAPNGDHRSHASDNNLTAERFKNPSGKTRNFTTNPPNNSTPDLPHTFEKASNSSTNSPADSNSSQSSQIKKKNSILSYARQRLNLHTSKQNQPIPTAAPLDERSSMLKEEAYPEPVVPNLTLSDTPRDTLASDLEYTDIDSVERESTSPRTEEPEFKTDSNSAFNGVGSEQNIQQEDQNEYFGSSALPDRKIPQIHGPRPYYDSDSNSNGEDLSEVPFNFGTHEQQGTVASASQPSFANADPEIPQYDERHNEFSIQSEREINQTNKLHVPEYEKSQSTGFRSSSQSFETASSVQSFDEKFMLRATDDDDDADHINDLSQETLGGLGGLRRTIQSTEGNQDTVAVVPNLKNPYSEGSKRISTLGTNDLKIYNLQSFDTDNFGDQGTGELPSDGPVEFNQINEMTVIQEGDSQEYRSSLEMKELHEPTDTNEMPESGKSTGVAKVPILTINRNSSCEDYDNVSFKDAEQGDFERGENIFVGEKSSVVTDNRVNITDTPDSSPNPFLPESDSSEPKTTNVNGISDLINDLDNFGLTSNKQDDESELYQNKYAGERYDQQEEEEDEEEEEQEEEQEEGGNKEIGSKEAGDREAGDFEIPPRHFEKRQLQVHQYQKSPPVSNSDTETTHTCSHPYALLSHSSYTPSVSSPPLRMSSGFTTPDKDIKFDENKYETTTGMKELYYPPGEGPCRKCGDIILETEKKIWSKDNQLSGQWHRSCFGCHKCGSKFNKGSSCYVYEDQPYCECHFHELNGSLCQVCNRGVEGECLQNEVNEVFHIDCLKCVICGLNVEGDYFIFRDEVMCETDAKELMYQIEEAEKEYHDKDVEKMIKRRTRVLYL